MNHDSRSLRHRSSSHDPSDISLRSIPIPNQEEDQSQDEALSDTELLASPIDYENLNLNLNSNLHIESGTAGQQEDSDWEPGHDSLQRELSDPPEIPEEVPANFLSLYFSQQETAHSQGLITSDFEDQKAEDSYRFRFTRIVGNNASNERSKSAPPRPLTDIEAFRESSEFLRLEAAALATADLLLKSDGKLDLDSVEGNNNCKNFLNKIEELAMAFKTKCADRSYRDSFSQPYKALYKEGSLCYLTEILDSAQEGLPYILVNSEKYIFSANVLSTGEDLFIVFLKLKDLLRDAYDV